MINEENKLVLLNSEGNILTAYKLDSRYVIIDEFNVPVRVLNVYDLKSFFLGHMEIIDSKKRRYNFREQSVDMWPREDMLNDFLDLPDKIFYRHLRSKN